jgi:hypothetical protein
MMGRFLPPKKAVLPTREYRLQQRADSWRAVRCDGLMDTTVLIFAAPSQAKAREIIAADAERLGVRPAILVDYICR